MAGNKIYTDEQKAKVLAIINSQKKQNSDWNEIANVVNSQNILPRKFDGRSLFKTTWFWNKKMNESKSAKKSATPVTAKRSYKRKPQIEVLPVANVNTDDNVIVLVVKSSNIRSVLEQLQ